MPEKNITPKPARQTADDARDAIESGIGFLLTMYHPGNEQGWRDEQQREYYATCPLCANAGALQLIPQPNGNIAAKCLITCAAKRIRGWFDEHGQPLSARRRASTPRPLPESADAISRLMELGPGGDAARILRLHSARMLLVNQPMLDERRAAQAVYGLQPGGSWGIDAQQRTEWHYAALEWLEETAIAERQKDNTEHANKLLTARLQYAVHHRRPTAVDNAFAAIPPIAQAQAAAGRPFPGLQTADWDALNPPGYIGCANGVVALDGPELLTGAAAAAQLVTQSTGIDFDAAAQHPDVDALIHRPDVDAELMEFVLASLGHALRGIPPQYAISLHDAGAGAAGKTTLLTAAAHAAGQYGTQLHLDALKGHRKNDAGRATPELMPLLTARIAIVAEAANSRIDEERWKMLTGGDTINARYLRENPTQGFCRATIFTASNRPIDLQLADAAAFRRYRPVLVPSIPERQRNLSLAAAFSPANDPAAARRQAMLATLIGYAAAYPQPPETPGAITALAEQHRIAQRPDEVQWAVDNIQPNPNGALTTDTAWEHYRNDLGDDASTDRQAFTKAIAKHFGVKVARKRIGGKITRYFDGLLLNAADYENPEFVAE